MGGSLQDYNLISVLKKQVDCCKKMFIETKKSETQTTMREMDTIQVDCCKKKVYRNKKSKTQTISRKWTSRKQEYNKKNKTTQTQQTCEMKWTW